MRTATQVCGLCVAVSDPAGVATADSIRVQFKSSQQEWHIAGACVRACVRALLVFVVCVVLRLSKVGWGSPIQFEFSSHFHNGSGPLLVCVRACCVCLCCVVSQ